MKIEKRAFDISSLEIRSEGAKLGLVGYAAPFDKLSVDLGGFREVIRRGAFSKTIQADDIRSLWNHNSDHVLARNINKTLRLSEDDNGLKIEIDLPDTQFARDAAESIRRGDVSQMSFAFSTISDRWGKQDGEEQRELLEVKLFEVSPVTFPAYPDTSISSLRGSRIDLDALSSALRRTESAGVEARSEDLQTIEAAQKIISEIRGNAKREQQESVEARCARIRRELQLLEI